METFSSSILSVSSRSLYTELLCHLYLQLLAIKTRVILKFSLVLFLLTDKDVSVDSPSHYGLILTLFEITIRSFNNAFTGHSIISYTRYLLPHPDPLGTNHSILNEAITSDDTVALISLSVLFSKLISRLSTLSPFFLSFSFALTFLNEPTVIRYILTTCSGTLPAPSTLNFRLKSASSYLINTKEKMIRRERDERKEEARVP